MTVTEQEQKEWWDAVYASMRRASDRGSRGMSTRDQYVYDNFGPCQHGDPYRRDADDS